jgi:hypothetical protein
MCLCPITAHSHIANTPAPLQSVYCDQASGFHNHDSSNMEVFPCGAPWLERVAHVLRHLHLGPSSDPPVLVTQLLMISGTVVAVSDFLKVWGPRYVGM